MNILLVKMCAFAQIYYSELIICDCSIGRKNLLYKSSNSCYDQHHSTNCIKSKLVFSIDICVTLFHQFFKLVDVDSYFKYLHGFLLFNRASPFAQLS